MQKSEWKALCYKERQVQNCENNTKRSLLNLPKICDEFFSLNEKLLKSTWMFASTWTLASTKNTLDDEKKMPLCYKESQVQNSEKKNLRYRERQMQNSEVTRETSAKKRNEDFTL